MYDAFSKPNLGKILLAGGSCFLGVSLAHYLADRGASVVILSRRPPKVPGPWRHVSWDARTLGNWQSKVDGAIALVNLVGSSVDRVWRSSTPQC